MAVERIKWGAAERTSAFVKVQAPVDEAVVIPKAAAPSLTVTVLLALVACPLGGAVSSLSGMGGIHSRVHGVRRRGIVGYSRGSPDKLFRFMDDFVVCEERCPSKLKDMMPKLPKITEIRITALNMGRGDLFSTAN